jgi:hypothetical protein
VAACRLYWSRHRERLGLDAILAERAAAGLGGEEAAALGGGAAAALPSLQGWAPLLDRLQQEEQAATLQRQALSAAAAVLGTPGEPNWGAALASAACAAVVAEHDGPPPVPPALAMPPPAGGAAPPLHALPAVPMPQLQPIATGPADAKPVAAVAAAAAAAVKREDESGEGGAASGAEAAAAIGSAAAALLPQEELDKLQMLLQPGELTNQTLSQLRSITAPGGGWESVGFWYPVEKQPLRAPFGHPTTAAAATCRGSGTQPCPLL